MSKVLDLTEMEQSKPFIGTDYQHAFFKESTHLLGFCFDGTTSFRPGARFGPDAIRDASFGLETYSSYQDRDIEDYKIIDCGNLPIYPSKWKITNDYFEKITSELGLQKDKIKLLTLGGEHSISYGPIVRYMKEYQDLFIIHLDAHADLRDGYLEEKYSHASIMRRVWDHKKESQEIIQYGIRSGTKEEFEFMKKEQTRANSLAELLQKVDAIAATRPIYLTLDLDYFDPAFFPGTGTPEAGGEDFHSFIKLIKILKDKNFVGADVVELAPMIDATGNSSAFASKVVREVLLALQD
jgi:agmatinase